MYSTWTLNMISVMLRHEVNHGKGPQLTCQSSHHASDPLLVHHLVHHRLGYREVTDTQAHSELQSCSFPALTLNTALGRVPRCGPLKMGRASSIAITLRIKSVQLPTSGFAPSLRIRRPLTGASASERAQQAPAAVLELATAVSVPLANVLLRFFPAPKFSLSFR